MQCTLCYRKTNNEYCTLHDKAYRNVVKSYQQWTLAKTITWTDYLKKIIDNQNSGFWVIEVCKYILSKEYVNINKE